MTEIEKKYIAEKMKYEKRKGKNDAEAVVKAFPGLEEKREKNGSKKG